MKPTQLAALGGVAVIALAAGIWLNGRGDGGATVDGVGDTLVPGLDAAINDVSRIRVHSGDDTLTLARDGVGWGVAEKNGYPANLDRVRKFLLDLARAELIEAKTSDPQRYATLGVEAAADGGTQVDLETAAGPLAGASLLIGNSARVGAATYVRRSDEAGSWLVSGGLNVESDAGSWLEAVIADVPGERIQSVVIEHPDGERVSLSKAARDETSYAVADIPEGKALRYASIANPIGSSLAGLRLEDVLPRSALNEEFTPVSTARFLTFDGLSVAVDTFERGEDRFVTLEVSYDDVQAARFAAAAGTGDTVASADGADDAAEADADDAPALAPAEDAGDTGATPAAEDGDAAASALADAAATEAEAAAIDAAVSGWVYAIGRYKFDQLTRRMDDLVEAPAEPTGEEGPPGTP